MFRTTIFLIFALFLFIELYKDMLKSAVSPFEFMLWSTGIGITTLLIIFPKLSSRISHFLGFELPSNLFFSTLIGLIYISIRNTRRSLAITQSQLTEIAQNFAVLKYIQNVEKNKSENNK